MKRTHLHHVASNHTVDFSLEQRDGSFRWTRGDTGEELQGQVVFTAPGEGFLDLHGRIVPFQAAPLEVKGITRGIELWMLGRVLLLERVEEAGGRARGPGAPTSGEVLAPMPGTILQIRVQPGDAVEVGTPLVIMESMKMEMTLASTVTGRVEAVGCKVGELVDMGTVLVRVHKAEDGTEGTAQAGTRDRSGTEAERDARA